MQAPPTSPASTGKAVDPASAPAPAWAANSEHDLEGATRRTILRNASLAALVLLALFTIGALASHDTAKVEWASRMQLLSRILAAHAGQTVSLAEATLASVTEGLRGTARADRASFADWASSRAQFESMYAATKANPFIDVVGLVDHRGTVLGYSRSHPPPSISLADRSDFQQLAKRPNTGVYISEPVSTRFDGKHLIFVVRRLHSEQGEFLGVAMVGLSVGALQEFYKQACDVLGKGASVALLRDDLTLLARWPAAPHALGRRDLVSTTQQLLLRPDVDASVELVDTPRPLSPAEPRLRLVSVHRVANQPLAVSAVATAESFRARWWIGMKWSALLLVATLLLLFLVTRRQWQATTRIQRIRQERTQAQQALLDAADGMEQRVAQRTTELRREIEQRQAREHELARVNARIAELSHLAGMAEVANSVLHNVGNVLNSLNTSSTLLLDHLEGTPLRDLPAVAGMLQALPAAPAGASDGDDQSMAARRLQAAQFLQLLADHWREEHALLLSEAHAVRERLQHIREIVTRQQSLTQAIGSNDLFVPAVALRMVLNMHLPSLLHAQVEVSWGSCDERPWRGQRNYLQQICLNLIVNAEQAFTGTPQAGRRLVIDCTVDDAGLLQIQIADNGMGFAPGVLDRLFTYGFTTRPNGHGLGLHASALAARAMGGTLEAFSAGPGHGARFILRLPQADFNHRADTRDSPVQPAPPVQAA